MLAPVARFAPCGLAELTATGVITTANETLVGWIGLPTEQVVGRELFDFVDDEDGKLRAALQSDEWDGTPFTLARDLHTSDAPRPLLLASSSYVVDGELRMSVVFFDGTLTTRIAEQTTDDRDEARRMSDRLQVLVDTAASFGRSGSEAELAEQLIDAIHAATGADEVAVYLLGDDEKFSYLAGTNPLRDYYPSDAPTIAGEALRTGEPVLLTSPSEAAAFAPGWNLESAFTEAGVHSVIVAPVIDQTSIGSVTAFFRTPRQMDDQILPLAGALARQAAQTFVRLRLEAEARRAANRDSVTGLANRRLLEERTAALATSPDTMVAALFLDLDKFKQVNDEGGHAVGDLLLEEVGRRITAIVRDEDSVARYGGDEFVAICAVPDEETALAIAERVREAIAQPYDEVPKGIVIRASVGLAIASTPVSVDRLIRDADAAMYEAKGSGGNLVMRSSAA